MINYCNITQQQWHYLCLPVKFCEALINKVNVLLTASLYLSAVISQTAPFALSCDRPLVPMLLNLLKDISIPSLLLFIFFYFLYLSQRRKMRLVQANTLSCWIGRCRLKVTALWNTTFKSEIFYCGTSQDVINSKVPNRNRCMLVLVTLTFPPSNSSSHSSMTLVLLAQHVSSIASLLMADCSPSQLSTDSNGNDDLNI